MYKFKIQLCILNVKIKKGTGKELFNSALRSKNMISWSISKEDSQSPELSVSGKMI